MAASNFNIQEILDLSKLFINEGTPENEEIKNIPEIAWTISHFLQAYQILCDTQPSENNPALIALFESGAIFDDIHDDALRALDCLIQAAIFLDNGDLLEKLKQLKIELLPQGLLVTQMSYRAEAGEVTYRNARLTPASRELLESLSFVPFGTLAEILARAHNAALELGKIENQKADLLKDQKDGPSRQEVLGARRLWVRTMNSFMNSAGFITPKSEMLEKIINRIQIAEENADRRAKRVKAAKEKNEDGSEE